MPYATSNIEGADFNQVFILDPSTPEYPNPNFAVGQIVEGTDGTVYAYVRATTAFAIGDCVAISNAFAPTLLTTAATNGGLPVGIVPVTVTAISGTQTAKYFWAQVKGVCPAISVLASCAANVRLNTTATPGALDDDGTAGAKEILGITLTTARAASPGTAPGVLNYPVVKMPVI